MVLCRIGSSENHRGSPIRYQICASVYACKRDFHEICLGYQTIFQFTNRAKFVEHCFEIKFEACQFWHCNGCDFQKIVAGNAKAGAKALIGSFGKVVGITAAINAVFNLVESGFNVTDPNVWIDTAIDTAIGVASYYLAAGMMAGIGALFFAGSLPGVVMMVGVVVLSWVIENMIRWIIGYQD